MKILVKIVKPYLLLLFLAVLSAQPLSQITWAALSATGTTTAFAVPASDIHTLTWAGGVTGSPTGCTANLDGSLDNVNWFDISGGQDCTSGNATPAVHVVNRSVAFVRGHLTALSGGTAPTVTLKYLGHSSGGRQ